MEAEKIISPVLYRVAVASEEVIGPDRKNAGDAYLLLTLKPKRRVLAAAKQGESHRIPLFDPEDLSSFFDIYEPLTKKETLTAKEQATKPPLL